MLLRNCKYASALLLIGLFITACSPSSPVSPSTPNPLSGAIQPVELTPYLTTAPRITPSPVGPGTPASLPSPSPTPTKHTVASGEDMGSIAFRYHITIQALLAANPDINPKLMSVGTELNIPAGAAPAGTQAASKPTPISIPMDAPQCNPSQDGGLWCFLLVHNNQKTALEGVSASIRIADLQASQVISQVALPPLDTISAGAAAPLVAYFPGPVPQPFQASAELLTALTLPDSSTRYIPVQLKNVQVEIMANGLAARLRGEVVLNAQKAARIWVAAVAYDSNGKITGVRRWEDSQPSSAGSAHFDFYVYSTGANISRADLTAEARP
jgi:LysM repeat protein